MNNIFDIKRFGQYFLYDLRRAWNNYGLSLLLMGLIPIILYVVYQLISLNRDMPDKNRGILIEQFLPLLDE